MRSVVSKVRSLDTINGPDRDFFAQFAIAEGCCDVQLSRKLRFIVTKLSPYLNSLTVDAAVFSKVLEFAPGISERPLLFPCLRSLHVVVGNLCGPLTSEVSSSRARWFAAELKSVKVTVNLSSESESQITCCSFKALIKLLSAFMGAAGTWSLCLKDATRRAQGWFSPVELSQNRHTAFISYVRAILDLGIALQSLELVDDLKMSPYMIVMQKQRRFLYMYDEFKKCETLVVCYDIGIVAPSFHPTQAAYPELKSVELVASHVLCKNDLVLYLSDAPNLDLLRILQPPHWLERVKRCTYGCFRNDDYGCFMDWGWASVPSRLPHTCLRFDCCLP
ncbi:unnamed protein product [Toxocara canis]|nr:unnamed protein product [Toxocara canis]